jgi:hypothetical protein
VPEHDSASWSPPSPDAEAVAASPGWPEATPPAGATDDPHSPDLPAADPAETPAPEPTSASWAAAAEVEPFEQADLTAPEGDPPVSVPDGSTASPAAPAPRRAFGSLFPRSAPAATGGATDPAPMAEPASIAPPEEGQPAAAEGVGPFDAPSPDPSSPAAPTEAAAVDEPTPAEPGSNPFLSAAPADAEPPESSSAGAWSGAAAAAAPLAWAAPAADAAAEPSTPSVEPDPVADGPTDSSDNPIASPTAPGWPAPAEPDADESAADESTSPESVAPGWPAPAPESAADESTSPESVAPGWPPPPSVPADESTGTVAPGWPPPPAESVSAEPSAPQSVAPGWPPPVAEAAVAGPESSSPAAPGWPPAAGPAGSASEAPDPAAPSPEQYPPRGGPQYGFRAPGPAPGGGFPTQQFPQQAYGAPAQAQPAYPQPGYPTQGYPAQQYGYAQPGYPAPGYAPWGGATVPPKKKRRWLKALVAVVVLAAIVVTAVVVVATRHHGLSHPSKWDPRVLSIVQFDQKTRQLNYKHPVYIEFLTPHQYTIVSEGGAQNAKPDPNERRQADQEVGQFRALGLVQGSVDLYAADREVADDGTLAFYDPDTGRVYVRGTKFTPELRVTLAHELTHALQDQYFPIKSIENMDENDDTTYRSVIEGDAVRIQNQYVDHALSKADKATYEKEQDADSNQAETKLEKSVPDVLLADQQVPYIFGESFVDIVHKERGYPGVNSALAVPPLSEQQIVDPFDYIDDVKPKHVAPIALPKGATELDRGTYGSVRWYLQLAERIDPRKAMTAAIDGWGGDTMLTYEQHDQVCVQATFEGTDAAASQTMATDLKAWAASMPSGVASTSTSGDLVSFKSCDPGPKAKLHVTGRSTDSLAYPATRDQIIDESLTDGATRQQSVCYANAVVNALTLPEITDQTGAFEKTAKFQAVLQAAGDRCR